MKWHLASHAEPGDESRTCAHLPMYRRPPPALTIMRQKDDIRVPRSLCCRHWARKSPGLGRGRSGLLRDGRGQVAPRIAPRSKNTGMRSWICAANSFGQRGGGCEASLARSKRLRATLAGRSASIARKLTRTILRSGVDVTALQSRNERPTPIRPTIITATVLNKVHRR